MHLKNIIFNLFPTADLATNRTTESNPSKNYHIISPKVLQAEIDERLSAKKDNLIATLNQISSVSAAIDVWRVRQKTFMSVVINWIDSSDYRRTSSVIACDVITSSTSSEELLERIKQIYSDYGISDKVVATVTNNSLYDMSNANNEITYLSGFLDSIANPTYLFELIGTEKAQTALADEQYNEAYQTAIDKYNTLFDYITNNEQPDESILKGLFSHPYVGSKVSELYNSTSNLVGLDSQALNKILIECNIPTFTDSDLSFLKEYSVILEPIATAIEYLQTNSNRYYATLLPMVYSIKDSLTNLQNQGEMQLCLPLLNAILHGVEQIFAHLFDFDNEQCVPAIIATCTHSHFKMRWLKGHLKTPTNTNKILDLLVKVAKEYDNDIKKDIANDSDNTNNGKN